MNAKFDEVSLKYWKDNRVKSATKSYICIHNGYAYGDDMDYSELSFVHTDNGSDIVISGETLRRTYVKAVEAVCNDSVVAFDNYRQQSAYKFGVFSEEEVAGFPQERRNSTRIHDDNCAIYVNGEKYYVASNLKVCEYFNALCSNIEEKDLDKWLIRISLSETVKHKELQSTDELEEIEKISASDFVITLVETNDDTSSSTHKKEIIPGSSVSKHVDYLAAHKKKKDLGDLGELLVIEYEKSRLMAAGRNDLAEAVEHSSKTQGDGLGYDIRSFSEDGTELFIEVKSTKQNYQDHFQMSENEVLVANKMHEEGKQYQIYRLYSIRTRTGKAKLRIYYPPFTEDYYGMAVDSYTITI